MKYINLTNHSITETITGTTIEPSGQTARVDNPSAHLRNCGSIPVYGNNPTAKVIGLPEPQPDTIYIVSNLVLNHIKNRADVVATGAPVKQRGQIIGCKGFRSAS